MVTKSIERAQKKVEENNFGIRKRLLEYDDVMNIQREAIYKKRANALSGERLSVDLHNMFTGMVDHMVMSHKEYGDFESFRQDIMRIIGMDPKIEAATFKESSVDDIAEQFQVEVAEHYEQKATKVKIFSSQ